MMEMINGCDDRTWSEMHVVITGKQDETRKGK